MLSLKHAFRLYTKDMAAELSAIITLTPEQFHELSADVKDAKNSAAQLLTKEALTSLPIEYVAKLSEELLGATPAASFAAFYQGCCRCPSSCFPSSRVC